MIAPDLSFRPVGGTYVPSASGLYLPERVVDQQRCETRLRSSRLKAVDVFAGAGGFSCGAMMAGMEVVAAIERDTDSVMTYMTNLCRHGEVQLHYIESADRDRMAATIKAAYKRVGIHHTKDGQIRIDGKTDWRRVPLAGSGWIAHEPTIPGVKHIIIGDVRKLTGARLLKIIGMERGELGCLFGGPPCQGFSTAGKRHVMDPRNSLVFEYARLVVETKPTTTVMENVPGILTMVTEDGVPVVDALARILEDGGFGGYEAFRRSIQAQAGSVGLLRGKPKPPRKGRRKQPEGEAVDGCTTG